LTSIQHPNQIGILWDVGDVEMFSRFSFTVPRFPYCFLDYLLDFDELNIPTSQELIFEVRWIEEIIFQRVPNHKIVWDVWDVGMLRISALSPSNQVENRVQVAQNQHATHASKTPLFRQFSSYFPLQVPQNQLATSALTPAVHRISWARTRSRFLIPRLISIQQP
jgi:hypothetical protein